MALRHVVWPDGVIRMLTVDERVTHVVFRPGLAVPHGWWIDSEHRSLAAAERAAGRRNLAAARAHVAEVLNLAAARAHVAEVLAFNSTEAAQ